MLVINSKVDVALVADKLDGSSGEQDKINKEGEFSHYRIMWMFSPKPCCPTFFTSS